MGFRKIMLIMQPPLMTGVLVWVMDLILLNKIRRKMQLNGGGPECHGSGSSNKLVK